MEEEIKIIGEKVRNFYEKWSFPGYEDFEDIHDLVQKANRNHYTRLLDEQIQYGTRILDAGCGTGQLAIFLSLTNRKVCGVDFSFNSLSKGVAFKRKFQTLNAQFVQMDLFQLGLRKEKFDFIFSNGVLHHTADARKAFQFLCTLLKPKGFIILGLYNTYGRFFLDFRGKIFKLTSDRFKNLDYYVRQKWMGSRKKIIWFKDQYKHPHSDTFTVEEILEWFSENNIEYINSIPKIRLGEHFSPSEKLFEKHEKGTWLDHKMTQWLFTFTQGKEGGFFITIGQKGETRHGNA